MPKRGCTKGSKRASKRLSSKTTKTIARHRATLKRSGLLEIARHTFTCFPFLNQVDDIADIPKALFKAAGHSRRHTDG